VVTGIINPVVCRRDQPMKVEKAIMSTKPPLKVGYLGKIDFHYLSLRQSLQGQNVVVQPLEYSLADMRGIQLSGAINKCRKKLGTVHQQLFGTSGEAFLTRMKQYLADYDPDVIIAYWGTNIISDAIAIKKYSPRTKILLNVLCCPLGLSSISVELQNLYMRYGTRYFDGFIYSSRLMQDYFEKNILRGRPKPSATIPPVLSKEEVPAGYLPACANFPNIVFLGRPDWWAGQSTDNLDLQLSDLASKGIHVYHAGQRDQKTQASSHRHLYPSMDLRKLAVYVTQFEASLVMYNLDACQRDDRFKVTIPDRLIASVTFGLPIAIPRKGYDACKDFLRQYEAVIEFDSFDELKAQLSDREKVEALKARARENSTLYSVEAYTHQWMDFLATYS